ncbi:MAG: hypothetical protein Q8807_04185 ['Waltheria sp.' little leaf phytoplasma]|nr:hypothetical protein ['Waltheria sp.' little leaf phytoplasma]
MFDFETIELPAIPAVDNLIRSFALIGKVLGTQGVQPGNVRAAIAEQWALAGGLKFMSWL